MDGKTNVAVVLSTTSLQECRRTAARSDATHTRNCLPVFWAFLISCDVPCAIAKQGQSVRAAHTVAVVACTRYLVAVQYAQAGTEVLRAAKWYDSTAVLSFVCPVLCEIIPVKEPKPTDDC